MIRDLFCFWAPALTGGAITAASFLGFWGRWEFGKTDIGLGIIAAVSAVLLLQLLRSFEPESDKDDPLFLSNFGAVGDGREDDTLAFRRFLFEVALSGREGILEEGSYLVSDCKVATGLSVRLRGLGKVTLIQKREIVDQEERPFLSFENIYGKISLSNLNVLSLGRVQFLRCGEITCRDSTFEVQKWGIAAFSNLVLNLINVIVVVRVKADEVIAVNSCNNSTSLSSVTLRGSGAGHGLIVQTGRESRNILYATIEDFACGLKYQSNGSEGGTRHELTLTNNEVGARITSNDESFTIHLGNSSSAIIGIILENSTKVFLSLVLAEAIYEDFQMAKIVRSPLFQMEVFVMELEDLTRMPPFKLNFPDCPDITLIEGTSGAKIFSTIPLVVEDKGDVNWGEVNEIRTPKY